MKATIATICLAYVAGTAVAVPMTQKFPRARQDGGNLVSDIFDGGACIVSSVIGGGNPKCHKTPPGTSISGPAVSPEDSSNPSGGAVPYTFTYTTNPDGMATYVIKPNGSGKSCNHNVDPSDPDLTAKLDQFAKDCVRS